jgi:tripartite ATP-independent transporter DctP family solute receptor|tara:strand:+ start:4167 stop:5144 length:978 start_codon:yes stop_codon:yes gene_type:complete
MKTSMIPLAVAISATLISSAEARELRLGHSSTESNPRHDAALYFADRVEELSGGDLTVSVNSNAQLGDDVEMMTGLRLGTIDLSISSQGAMASVVEEATLVGLPFLFKDSHVAWEVLDGEVGNTLKERAAESGTVVLGFWDNGIRLITNDVRPVVEPSDLKGLKIRIPQDPMATDIFSALGANPVPIPFAETYVALQQGVADGQENPAVNIYSQKFHEVQDYLSLSHHKYEFLPLLASQTTWNTLTPEQQDILFQAGQDSTDFQRDNAYQANQDRLEEIEASGTQITDVNTEAFQSAVSSVYDKWRDKYPEFVNLIISEAKKAGE